MVLKASKCGLNTGNTIRKGRRNAMASVMSSVPETISTTCPFSSFDVDWLLQTILNSLSANNHGDFVRYYEFYSLFEQFEAFCELHLDMFDTPDPTVPRSLNKSKRWLWPDLLEQKRNILNHQEVGLWRAMGFLPKISLAENSVTSGRRLSYLTTQVSKPESNKGHKTAKMQRKHDAGLARNYRPRGVQRRQNPKSRSKLSETADDDDSLTPTCFDYTVEKHGLQEFRYLEMDDVDQDHGFRKKSLKKSKGLKNKHIYDRVYGMSYQEISEGTVASLVEAPKRTYQYTPKHLRKKRRWKNHVHTPHTEKSSEKVRVFLTETEDEIAKEKGAPEKTEKENKRGHNKRDKHRARENLMLWQFIDIALNKATQDKVVKFHHCKSEAPCVKSSINKESQSIPRPPAEPALTLESRLAITSGTTGYIPKEEEKAIKKKKNNMSKRRRDRLKRKNGVQDPSGDTGSEKDNVALDKQQQTFWPHLLVKLKTKSTNSALLLKTYGDRFKEASTSSPRRFWLDMTRSVGAKEDKNMKNLTSPEKILSVLVFELVSLRPANSNGNHEVYRMYPRIDTSKHLMTTITDAMEKRVKPHLIYPLHKLVDYYEDSLRSLFSENPYNADLRHSRRHCPTADERRRNTMDWLYSFCDWRFSIMSASEAYATLKNGCDLQRPSSAQLRRAALSQETVACETCKSSLQYDLTSLVPVSSNTSSRIPQSPADIRGYPAPCVRIIPCQHSFCTTCFRDSLERKVKEAETPLTCPGFRCNTIIDPVTMLCGMTLKSYNDHFQLCLDRRITQHPQWQWCPHTRCGRAVKLLGSSLLDCAVVIQCVCGHVWCFHCRQRAHWPASCSQAASYAKLKEKDEAADDGMGISKVLCSNCDGRQLSDDRHQDVCSCYYAVCTRCLNLTNSPLEIPRSLVNEKMTSLEGAAPSLLPLLMYRSARWHGKALETWNQTQVETRTNSIIRLIQRSRSKHTPVVGSSLDWARTSRSAGPLANQARLGRGQTTAASWSGLPHPTLSHVSPNLDSEKILIIIVYQFLHQAHFLLENVYVMLFRTQTSDKSRATANIVVRLEKVVSSIETLLSSLLISPSQLVLRLKRLMDTGKKLVLDIAQSVRSLRSSDVLKSHTLLPLAFPTNEVPSQFSKQGPQLRSLTKA